MNVLGTEVSIRKEQDSDYISLTDMAKHFGDDTLVHSWMRNRNTIELLGIWETMHNPAFKGVEFDTFKSQAGLNSFRLTPKRWVEATGAIGIQSRPGRYGGGTFAHQDIAFEFGSWLSPEFKLFLIKEFQRLKADENIRQSLDWNLNRTLARLNYRIHTDAIKAALDATEISRERANFIYASEADILNVALFGLTSKEWRAANPQRDGNIRDFASVEQLLVLANLESLNAELIRTGVPPIDRLDQLNRAAVSQLKSLGANAATRKLTETIQQTHPTID